MTDNRNDKLSVSISDGRLVISLGIETLVWALEHSGPLEEYNERTGEYENPKVTDVDAFAKDVMYSLLEEEEDGSNAITRLLDSAMLNAIEQGSENVEMTSEKK